MANLDRHSLLFKSQFGFRPSAGLNGTSCYFADLIIKEADSGKAKGAVFIDLPKAFNTIRHSVLHIE